MGEARGEVPLYGTSKHEAIQNNQRDGIERSLGIYGGA